MPAVSYDSRSFSIDGRRVWLVSGTVSYSDIPRGLWRDRLQAAKQAGLNCIEVPIVWNAHEQQPGVFNFDGELDLRSFVQAAGEEGLYVILRPGPYIGADWDFGGLPSYLHGVADKKGNRVKFREDEPQFLEAVDRYFRALMEQVGDLEVASPGPSGSASHTYPPGSAAGGYQGEGGGPIVLMQVEHAWESHDPEQPYLDRLVSMLRQHGCKVPLVNTNNLWQPVEGTIDAWRGNSDLPAIMRQLASIQTEAPPMVMQFEPGTETDPDDVSPKHADARQAQQLGGLIGVGAQFNLASYRDTAAARRLCTFASQFGHVLAATKNLAAPTIAPSGDNASLLHLRGNQGELVMLLNPPGVKRKQTPLMLPNGLTLEIPHANQRAAWVLLDTNLGGVATLDYTSLSPWAVIGSKLLVVFGPPGAEGVISIDGEHHSVTVPTGKSPVVIEGDTIQIAVLNHEQIDAAYRSPDGLAIGCDGLDSEGKPRPLPGWGTQFTVKADGKLSRKRVTQPKPASAPKLDNWQTLSLKELIDGSDARYQPIDGPADLGALGQAFGYGWYRFKTPKAVDGKLMLAQGGDRLHLYSNGKYTALLGNGEPIKSKLNGEVVLLADNDGRCSEGQELGQDLKGLAGHLYTIKPLKPAKPKRLKQPASDPFELVGYAHHQRAGTRPMSEALAWTIKPESRKPVVMVISSGPSPRLPAVISVNDTHVRFDAGGADANRPICLLLDPGDDSPMTGGQNTIKLELLLPAPDGVSPEQSVSFFQTTGHATPKDGLAFAPWSVPSGDESDWRKVPKTLPGQPAWLKASFKVASNDAHLWLEPHGLSKGQVFLNGHDLGRYWVQTRERKQVSPEQRIYLPEPWLKTHAPNDLMIFDEHGRTPEKCRLVYRS